MTPRARAPGASAAPALLTGTILLWGTAYVATDFAIEHAPPLMVAGLRAAPAALVLVAALPLVRGRLPRTAGLWGWAALTGLLMVGLIVVGISEGTARAGPGNAAVLVNTSPFFVLVLGRLFLGERISWLGATGLIAGFVGVVLMMSTQLGAEGDALDLGIGMGLALAAAIGFGVGTMLVRRLHGRADLDVGGFTAAQYLVGAPVLLVVGFGFEGTGGTDWGAPGLWGPAIYLGVGSSALASLLFLSALRWVPATRASSWQFLSPAVAVVVELVRGNIPPAIVLAGMILTIAGVALANRAPLAVAQQAGGAGAVPPSPRR